VAKGGRGVPEIFFQYGLHISRAFLLHFSPCTMVYAHGSLLHMVTTVAHVDLSDSYAIIIGDSRYVLTMYVYMQLHLSVASLGILMVRLMIRLLRLYIYKA